MHLGMTISNSRTSNKIIHIVDDWLELRLTYKIYTTKNDPVVIRSWLEGHRDFLASVE
jgi:hypothetical protein